jgi:nicotinamide-nucleotide amidase
MEIADLIKKLGEAFIAKKLMLVTAESCTGGMVAEAITSLAGSSNWFERGFVTYSNAAKQEMLGVKRETIENFGAVSEETACEMAEGALAHSHAQVGLAVTGIAGPEGGTETKPVGTVCFAWSQIDRKTTSITKHFVGDRTSIRQQAAFFALSGLL